MYSFRPVIADLLRLVMENKPVTIVSIMSSNLAVLKMGEQFNLHVLLAKCTRQLGLYITSDLLKI